MGTVVLACGVVTTTGTGPGVPGGVTTVSDVPPAPVMTLLPGTPPKVITAPPGGKLAPKTVTVCPPAVGPEIGARPEAAGPVGPARGRVQVALARVIVPAGTVTRVPLGTTLSVIV